jgi:magnesium-transporting ATPase (P-type)
MAPTIAAAHTDLGCFSDAIAPTQRGLPYAQRIAADTTPARCEDFCAARGFAFTVLLTANVMLILSNRSQSTSALGALRVSNPLQWVVAGSALAVVLVMLYLPWAAEVLHVAPLEARMLAAALALGGVSVLWFEGVRRLRAP